MRNLWGLLALAAAAAVSATTSSSAQVARPTLVLVQRAPLVVQGAHYRPRELVRLSATDSAVGAVTVVTTTRKGRLVARFAHFAVPACLRVVVRASGRRGDRATLVIDPKPGATGIPCGL